MAPRPQGTETVRADESSHGVTSTSHNITTGTKEVFKLFSGLINSFFGSRPEIRFVCDMYELKIVTYQHSQQWPLEESQISNIETVYLSLHSIDPSREPDQNYFALSDWFHVLMLWVG